VKQNNPLVKIFSRAGLIIKIRLLYKCLAWVQTENLPYAFRSHRQCAEEDVEVGKV